MNVTRDHWLSTIVGMIDLALHLDIEEKMTAIPIVKSILELLDIPDRSVPTSLPASVVLEAEDNHFSRQLMDDAPRQRRRNTSTDELVTPLTWAQALVSLVVNAYPDISPEERILALQRFSQLITALGVPERTAYFYPSDVLREYRDFRTL